MRVIIIGLACVIASVVADVLFLPHQSLWNDEATQLAGISLDPLSMMKWLAGRVDYDFGIPDDRMPPLSYLAGWVWSKALGFGERPMRWFGIACVAGSTAIVYATAARAWGVASGVASALLLATSPNVVVISVEIRAYPLLILTASGLFACLVGYASGPPESRRKWLMGLLVCGVASMYTHFFGLVAFGGAFVGVFGLTLARREKLLPVILLGIAAGLLATGLAPFVFASTSMSPSAPSTIGQRGVGLVRLVYRFFAHPSMALSTAAVGLAGLGLVLGLGSGLARKGRLDSGWASTALALALASGFVVVALAQMGQSKFAAASTSYNIWMYPAMVLVVGSGLSAGSRAVRSVSLGSVVLILAANAYADTWLAYQGDAFAHTAHRHIAALIRSHDPREVAVIHDDDVEPTIAYQVFGPIHVDFGGTIRQFTPVAPNLDVTGLRVTEYPFPKTQVDLDTLPFRYLIVIRAESRSAQEIASSLSKGGGSMGDGSVVRALLQSPHWERVEQKDYLAIIAEEYDVFRKIDRPLKTGWSGVPTNPRGLFRTISENWGLPQTPSGLYLSCAVEHR